MHVRVSVMSIMLRNHSKMYRTVGSPIDISRIFPAPISCFGKGKVCVLFSSSAKHQGNRLDSSDTCLYTLSSSKIIRCAWHRPTSSSRRMLHTTTDVDVVEKVLENFPGALRNRDFASKVNRILLQREFGSNTILATSFCSDEINRSLEQALVNLFGQNFSMGGLSGFPFAGVTGFGAYCSHIPDGGQSLIVYGPHVGIDAKGNFGMVDRRGISATSTCCGSAVGALGHARAVQEGTAQVTDSPDFFDSQQRWVEKLLFPHLKRIQDSNNEHVELPNALLDCQKEFMNQILKKGESNIPHGTPIAIIGGIQVNTPLEMEDYFCTKSFQILNSRNEVLEDLIDDFNSY